MKKVLHLILAAALTFGVLPTAVTDFAYAESVTDPLGAADSTVILGKLTFDTNADLPNKVQKTFTVSNGVLNIPSGCWSGPNGWSFTSQKNGKIRISFDFMMEGFNKNEAHIVLTQSNNSDGFSDTNYSILSYKNDGETNKRGMQVGVAEAVNNDGNIGQTVQGSWYSYVGDVDMDKQKITATVTVKTPAAGSKEKAGDVIGTKTVTDLGGGRAGYPTKATYFDCLSFVGALAAGMHLDNLEIKNIYDAPTVSEEKVLVTYDDGQKNGELNNVEPGIDSIEIDFSTTMSAASVNHDNLYLADKDGAKVSRNAQLEDGKAKIKFSGMLKADSDYKICIGKDIANLGGDKLGKDVTIDLKTNGGRVSGSCSGSLESGYTIDIKNSTVTDVTPMLIVAYYGDGNKLVDADIVALDTVAAGRGAIITKKLTPKTGESIKSHREYVWNGLSGRREVTGTEIYGTADDSALTMTYGDGEAAGSIVVSGNGAVSGDTLSILVLAGENSPESKLTETSAVFDGKVGDIAYVGKATANTEGKYSAEFKLPASGMYSTYVTSKYSGKCVSDTKMMYIDEVVYKGLVEDLNDQAETLKENPNDEATRELFAATVSENLLNLGLQGASDITADTDDAVEIFCNYAINNPLSESNKAENLNVWKKCLVVSALNNSTVSDVSGYIEDVITNSDLNSVYKTYITEGTHKAYLTQKMSGKDMNNIGDIESAFEDALILTVVKYPNGYMNIKTVLSMDEVKEITEITSISNNKDVYSALAGDDFDTIGKFKDEYEKLAKTPSKPTGTKPSGSGSGGGGGGGAPVKIQPTEDVKENTETVNMKFTDLDTVMWAYEAISTLSDKGIINGKSETMFDPRESVTREEFVKMVVLALNKQVSKSENIFADVDNNAWYCDYVNTAAKAGLINGIGNGKFGVGENIKRQDMAVILYNALKISGVDLVKDGGEFTDGAEISDYATEAVSKLSAVSVINGNDDGSFNPNGDATRAEAAQMIFNMINALA